MIYEVPETVDSAVALLSGATGSARILAGGTDLLVQMKSGVVEPDLVVDIKRIDGMKSITQEDGGWRIGAAVSGAEMGEHEALCGAWPGVVEAMELIGSTQVQGRATLAGNLCNASPAADSVPAMVAAATRPALAPRGADTTSITTISSPIVAIFEAEILARASASTRASAATWPVASGPHAVTTRCASVAAKRGAGPASAGTSL